MNIRNLKVCPRSILGFASLLILLFVILPVLLSRMLPLHEKHGLTSNERNPKLQKLSALKFRAMDNARIIRNLILINDANKLSFDKNLGDNMASMIWLQNPMVAPRSVALRKKNDGNFASYRDDISADVAMSLLDKKEKMAKSSYDDGSGSRPSTLLYCKNWRMFRKTYPRTKPSKALVHTKTHVC